MAARRIRLKGVLNIPTRRKPGAPNGTESTETPKESLEAKDKTVVKDEGDKKIFSEVSIKKNDEIPEKTNTGNETSIPRLKDVPEETLINAVKPPITIENVPSPKNVQPSIKLNNVPAKNSKPINTEITGIERLPNTKPLDISIKGDIEVPPSPTKVNRTRIKAIPRFGQRRTSFSIGSASESEDDTRRNYARIRNDSVCSITSNIDEPSKLISHTDSTNIPQSPAKKEFSAVIQRKCRRTEQSRRLATAKREFHLKFNKDKPDRQRLTMMDLIFYNPTTNPMSDKSGKSGGGKSKLGENENNVEEVNVEESTNTKNEDVVENVDDPLKLPTDDEEENDIPAPQIKVNANGDIIIDEQSLVIENKETVKGREEMAKASLVDGDHDFGYGIYKRVKRTKDWHKSETLRFYKALNTIGTDFTLMAQLFPKRTRRELKMKFKKEERINHALIDRAVLQPVQYDMQELENDLRNEEVEEQERELRKQEMAEAMKEASAERMQKRRRRERVKRVVEEVIVEEVIVEEVIVENEDSNGVEEKGQEEKVEKRKRKRRVVNTIMDVLDTEDDEPAKTAETDDEDNSPKRPKRKSKRKTSTGKLKVNHKKKENDTTSTITNSDKTEDVTENPDESCENLQPGSIMIVSTVDEKNATTYKLFMVTEDGRKVPVDLPAEDVKNLQANAHHIITDNGADSDEATPIDIILENENNYTINEEDKTIEHGNAEELNTVSIGKVINNEKTRNETISDLSNSDMEIEKTAEETDNDLIIITDSQDSMDIVTNSHEVTNNAEPNNEEVNDIVEITSNSENTSIEETNNDTARVTTRENSILQVVHVFSETNSTEPVLHEISDIEQMDDVIILPFDDDN